MIKKLIKYFLIIGLFFFLVQPVVAADDATLYLFWASGCPHCAKEKVFLNTLKDKYPLLTIKNYEITTNRTNLELLQKVGKKLQADVSGVPFTVIGDQYFAGYLNDETTGREIEKAIIYALKNEHADVVTTLIPEEAPPPTPIKARGVPEALKVPLWGKLQVKNLSLPVLTFIVALLDGFNPCAMWTLLFLISLLLGMKDKKRMWVLGSAFIASSAIVYFLFLSAWLNLFLFLGIIVWIRTLVGLVAIGAGAYYLRDYLTNKHGGCSVMGDEKRQRIFSKLREITQKPQFFLALGGIIALAIAVNMVELICSAGLPAIYTQILSLSNLPRWQYYLYLAFYILIFMLDDLFIFFTAMITLQTVGVQSKYARYSHLIGGILMLIIGLLLLFKPELLMFG